jgi:hypothetical protein
VADSLAQDGDRLVELEIAEMLSGAHSLAWRDSALGRGDMRAFDLGETLPAIIGHSFQHLVSGKTSLAAACIQAPQCREGSSAPRST